PLLEALDRVADVLTGRRKGLARFADRSGELLGPAAQGGRAVLERRPLVALRVELAPEGLDLLPSLEDGPVEDGELPAEEGDPTGREQRAHARYPGRRLRTIHSGSGSSHVEKLSAS